MLVLQKLHFDECSRWISKQNIIKNQYINFQLLINDHEPVYE